MIYGGLDERIQKMIETITSNAPEGSVFFDFGINDGEMSAHINEEIVKHVKDYIYFGFDPDTRFEQSYRNKFAAFPNIQVVKKAIGAVTQKAPFYLSSGYEKDSGGAILHSFFASSSIKKPTDVILQTYPHMKFDESQPVDVISLDDFCAENKVESIHLIWADIQGAELDMIKGGIDALKKTKYLYTEYNTIEVYEGCPNLQDLLNALPDWEVVEDFGSDVLLINKKIM